MIRLTTVPRGALLKVVVFTVVSAFVSLAIASTLIGGAGPGAQSYEADFSDASGLRVGDDVRIAGVKIGRVEGTELLDSGQARVSFSVKQDSGLTTTTHASIRYQNVIGQRYIALAPGAEPGQALPSGAVIGTDRTEPAVDLTLLFNGMKPLLTTMSAEEINDFGDKLIRTFQGEGGTIASLMEHTAVLSANFADRDAVIGQVIDNMNLLLESTTAHDDQIRALIAGLGDLTSGLADQRESIMASAEGISELADVTGDLLKTNRPQIQHDLETFSDVADDLVSNSELFVESMKASIKTLASASNVMSYGEWWNLYICQIKARAVVAFEYDGGPHSARCR